VRVRESRGFRPLLGQMRWLTPPYSPASSWRPVLSRSVTPAYESGNPGAFAPCSARCGGSRHRTSPARPQRPGFSRGVTLAVAKARSHSERHPGGSRGPFVSEHGFRCASQGIPGLSPLARPDAVAHATVRRNDGPCAVQSQQILRPPTLYVLCPTMSYVLCPTSYVLRPMSYVLCPTFYVLRPMSYVLRPTSHVLPPPLAPPSPPSPVPPCGPAGGGPSLSIMPDPGDCIVLPSSSRRPAGASPHQTQSSGPPT